MLTICRTGYCDYSRVWCLHRPLEPHGPGPIPNPYGVTGLSILAFYNNEKASNEIFHYNCCFCDSITLEKLLKLGLFESHLVSRKCRSWGSERVELPYWEESASSYGVCTFLDINKVDNLPRTTIMLYKMGYLNISWDSDSIV